MSRWGVTHYRQVLLPQRRKLKVKITTDPLQIVNVKFVNQLQTALRMFIASGDVVPSFKGFTLIMVSEMFVSVSISASSWWRCAAADCLSRAQPAVSVGNVGQLAVDLLISTLNMARVGHFHTDCLIPMAGNNPYATCAEEAGQLSTSAEGKALTRTPVRTSFSWMRSSWCCECVFVQCTVTVTPSWLCCR